MERKRFGEFLHCPVKPAVRAAVEQLAIETDQTLSDIVREILNEGLKARGIEC
jgi:uncharacterized membrane protein